MLSLSRKPREAIVIITPQGDTIEVIINRLSAGRCHLSFVAQDHIKIYRKEILTEQKDSECH